MSEACIANILSFISVMLLVLQDAVFVPGQLFDDVSAQASLFFLPEKFARSFAHFYAVHWCFFGRLERPSASFLPDQLRCRLVIFLTAKCKTFIFSVM